MNTIKQRAHQYAVAHEHNGNGVALMRAYTAGATDERMMKTVKKKYLSPARYRGLNTMWRIRRLPMPTGCCPNRDIKLLTP